MSKASRHPKVALPTIEEDKITTAAAKADPEAQPLTRSQLGGMVPMLALRGRPKLANAKLLISVRYSPEVLEYFRSTGSGWQARMDGVLKDYVSRKANRS